MKSYVEDHMRDTLANHVLEVHAETPVLQAFYLRPAKGGRLSSTLIVSTREGLVIMGDLCPRRNGVISCYGYGTTWFGGRLSEDYLCSKFLSRIWIPELGADFILRRIVEARRDGSIEKDSARIGFDAIHEAVRWGDLSYDNAHRIFTDAGLYDLEDAGHDYDPSDAGWLCAIQQRFAQLYAARAAVAA